MKKILILIFIGLFLFAGCSRTSLKPDSTDSSNKYHLASPDHQNDQEEHVDNVQEEVNEIADETKINTSHINKAGHTVVERFHTPVGYERIPVNEDSFGHYLRSMPLKPQGASVKYYDGREKPRDVHEAVVDMDVGKRDLQQCADAVMRLRAEYLYGKRQYDKIHFNFTNGFNAQYSKWQQGYRIDVHGNQVSWSKQKEYSKEYQSFREYLEKVFSYAGTLSLSKELVEVSLEELQIGDVFIQGGSPGHCVIVVDRADHTDTGETIFMLAQSYMPAQDIHILKNNEEQTLSPWYSENFGDSLDTPEWTFSKDALKRFSE